MTHAYGLDLAGYSTGKSALAKATRDGNGDISVVVYKDHPFSKKRKGQDLITECQDEAELVCKLKPLYVDAPLDLQGLNNFNKCTFLWEQTKRPVDYALVALPPLADKIGALVARMQRLRAIPEALGKSLFETYPAASLFNILQILQYKPSYKIIRTKKNNNIARFSKNHWGSDSGLAKVLNTLKIHANGGTVLNDDHLDAIICSLTGVVPGVCLLKGKELEDEVRKRLESKVREADRDRLNQTLPKGYVIIKKLPKCSISVTLQETFIYE